jgi:hypothetical protein
VATPPRTPFQSLIVAQTRDRQWRTGTTLEALVDAHDVLADRLMVDDDRTIQAPLAMLIVELMARGWHPAPEAYDGSWTGWWPPEGYGPCARCGEEGPVSQRPDTQTYECSKCARRAGADKPAGSAIAALMFRINETVLEARDAGVSPSEIMDMARGMSDLL